MDNNALKTEVLDTNQEIMDLLSNKRQCFRLFNQGNHGFLGPKSDLDLLNNLKRCRLIAKQIHVVMVITASEIGIINQEDALNHDL